MCISKPYSSKALVVNADFLKLAELVVYKYAPRLEEYDIVIALHCTTNHPCVCIPGLQSVNRIYGIRVIQWSLCQYEATVMLRHSPYINCINYTQVDDDAL